MSKICDNFLWGEIKVKTLIEIHSLNELSQAIIK